MVARVVRFALLALVLCVSVGCRGSRPPPPKNLPAATQSTTVGPGDVFEVYVLGEYVLRHVELSASQR